MVFFCFVFEKISTSLPILLVMLFVHAGKRSSSCSQCFFPDGIYLLKVNKRNTRTKCEICSRLTTKRPEQCHWHRAGVFIEHILHLALVFLLLTLNMLLLTGSKQLLLKILQYSQENSCGGVSF